MHPRVIYLLAQEQLRREREHAESYRLAESLPIERDIFTGAVDVDRRTTTSFASWAIARWVDRAPRRAGAA